MSFFGGLFTAVAGLAEIAVAVFVEGFTFGAATPLATMLVTSGAGMVLSGVGTMIAGNGPQQGFATTERHPTSPWKVCYGRNRVGGDMVYMNSWGANSSMLDIVVVLAAHSIESIDEILFDNQRLQINTTAIPTLGGIPPVWGGTSFNPIQQAGNTAVFLSSVVRDVNGVVTVVTKQDIPYLTAGDPIIVQNMTGVGVDPALNGTFTVAEIISRVPSGGTNILTFTFLNGGVTQNILNVGQCKTKWVSYGKNVYVEGLLGGQGLQSTFIGMQTGTPYFTSDSNSSWTPVSPESPGPAGGTAGPNPWTNYCSLQGKSAVFIRMKYDSTLFPSGIPQISFIIHGKNDIYDPRLGSIGGIGSVLNVAAGTGYQYGDVLAVAGGTGGQISVTSVTSSGAIETWNLTHQGSGYSLTSSAACTGGHGSGAECAILTLTGDAGTTGYSENSALCIADYLSNNTWGFKAQYGTEIPIAALEAAANVCDEHQPVVVQPINTSGGYENRWTCNGQFDLSMKRGEVLQNMLTSCAGRLVTYEGQYFIQPAYGETDYLPISTAVNLQEIAAGPIKWRPTQSISELYNGCKGTYISPENKWQSSDIPYYAQDNIHGYDPSNLIPQFSGDANLQADGGDRRWLDIQLPFTISSPTAQRICKIELLRRRNAGTGTFITDMRGYQYVPLDIIQADMPLLGWTNKNLEISAVRLRPDKQSSDSGHEAIALSVELDVQETSSAIYQWSLEEELTPQGYQQGTFPGNTVRETVPYPWSPGYVAPLAGDSYGIGSGSFGVETAYSVDGAGNPIASLQIKGTAPSNALSELGQPQITALGGTGGSLAAGTYVLACSAWSDTTTDRTDSDYLEYATVVIPSAGGQITGNIVNGPGDDGYSLYMALWGPSPTAGAYQWHKQQDIAAGVSTFTINTFDETTAGGPDKEFDRFAVVYTQIAHAGIWATTLEAVTPTTVTMGIPGTITANQYAGYTLSLLAKYDQGAEVPIVNIPVASNTATSGGLVTFTAGPNALSATLPDLTTLLSINDLLVMRFNATFPTTGTYANHSFSDLNTASPFYTTGFDPTVEPTHVALCLTGANAGDQRTIASVQPDINGNYTNVILASNWAITPATGDLVVILSQTSNPEVPTPSMIVKNNLLTGVMAQVNIANLESSTWLVRVRTENASGNHADDSLCPYREIYLYGAGSNRTITTSSTMISTDSLVNAEPSGTNITYTSLPFAQVENQTFSVAFSAGTGSVTVQLVGSDTFDDGSNNVVLTNVGDSVSFRVHQ